MNEPVGLRERKKVWTRRALTAAAIRLAVEKGSPDRVTVEEISEAAEVSPRTFFNYFSSKEEAILGVDPDRRTAIQAALELRPADEGPLDALKAALVSTAESFDEDAELWGQRLQLVRQHPSLSAGYVASFAELERGLVEAMAARLGLDPDEDVYPAIVVAAGLTVLRVVVRRWQAQGATGALGDQVDAALDQLARGLEAP